MTIDRVIPISVGQWLKAGMSEFTYCVVDRYGSSYNGTVWVRSHQDAVTWVLDGLFGTCVEDVVFVRVVAV